MFQHLILDKRLLARVMALFAAAFVFCSSALGRRTFAAATTATTSDDASPAFAEVATSALAISIFY